MRKENNMSKEILIVLTSHDQLGNTGKKTGFWLEELAAPFYLLKESGVTKRLADTARNSMIDIVTILLGLTVGASTQADVFLTKDSIMIFGLGAVGEVALQNC